MKQADPITFTPDSLREITALYDSAVAAGNAEFMYRNRQYSTRYVVYLIDMLRTKWGLRKPQAGEEHGV